MIASGLADGGLFSDQNGSLESYLRYAHDSTSRITAPSNDPGAASGLGLGGLVRYVASNPRAEGDEGRYTVDVAACVQEPVTGEWVRVCAFEAEIKRPSDREVYRATGEPRRPITGIDLPGFAPPMPKVYSPAAYLGDKLAELHLPPANFVSPESWRGYKNVLDFCCVIATHELRADDVHAVIHGGRQAEQFEEFHQGGPFYLHGEAPGSDERERLPWRQGHESLRGEQPQLRRHPSYLPAHMIRRFMTLIHQNPGSGAIWTPRTRELRPPVTPASGRPGADASGARPRNFLPPQR